MKSEFSAGGIIYKQTEGKTWVLLCQHSLHHGWVFPKGLIGDHIEHESKEATALREVQEETGALGKILKPLSPVTYWYVWEKEKVKKTVYYYLMEFVGGDITKHDTEMEDVEWLPVSEVEKRLSFKSDKKIWHEAKTIMENSE